MTAAGPRRPPAEIPFADPQKMFERMFGPETEEDEKALARVEVSVQEERQMGDAAVAAFLAGMRQRNVAVVARGKDVQYLRDLVETIRPHMTEGKRYPNIQVYLVQSSECEARTFPGGTIIFFRGLLELGGSEAAVLGIVGHEMSHLDRGHVLKRARRMKLAQQAFAPRGGFSPQQFMQAGTQMAQLFARPFRPEDEAAADRDGARWAYQAGYDPREMAKLFLLVGQRQQKNARAPLPPFLQSHPDAQSRHDAVINVFTERQRADPKDSLYIGKENLRARVARSQRKFAE